MDDFSTRPALIRRQGSAKNAAVLTAVFLLATGFAAALSPLARSAGSAADAPDQTAAIGRPYAHSIAIQIVQPGNEGLELTARLSDDTNLIRRDISWTVASAEGEVVFSGDAPVAEPALPPGDYVVRAHYGSTRLEQSLTLLPGNRLAVSFVLEMGGIRVLPRLAGAGLAAAESKTYVYAASGRERGRLITVSETPGEILRVSAGDYRIESRFVTGNASAITEVKVKPGRMSAVEIDHQAGLAHLAFVGAPDAAVSWQVIADNGEALPAVSGLTANFVLKPGLYRAEADVGSEKLEARFQISAGEQRDIMLGN